MAALSVSSFVSASRDLWIDDAKASIALAPYGLGRYDPCSSNSIKTSGGSTATEQHHIEGWSPT
jgi:hypothetical protein